MVGAGEPNEVETNTVVIDFSCAGCALVIDFFVASAYADASDSC